MRRRRVLIVGHSTYDLPLRDGDRRKWAALDEVFDVRVIASAGRVTGADPRFRLLRRRDHLESASFFGRMPLVVHQEARRHRAEAIIAASPYEAAPLMLAWPARRRPPLMVEVHGDWRTATRYYGSRLRRLGAWPADTVAQLALRRADGVRAVGATMAQQVRDATGRDPVVVIPTWFDVQSFWERPLAPLPETPALVWVGVLQEYKNPRMAIDAWRMLAARDSRARLHIVGRGPMEPLVQDLVAESGGRVRHDLWLEPADVARALDDAWALLLPSRSEGLPRVVFEAFARGRGVVGTRSGGIPDLVTDEHNGLLVPDGDVPALARALERLVNDVDLARRLGENARTTAEREQWTPEDYALALREGVEATLAAHARGRA